MAWTEDTDTSGHRYIEFPFGETEHLRVTYIPESYDGEERFRLQIRGRKGHLRQGPEVTYGELANLTWGAAKLRSSHNF